jgi:hypothetical protein
MINPITNKAIEKKYKPVNLSVKEWTKRETTSSKAPTIEQPIAKGLEFGVVICNFH